MKVPDPWDWRGVCACRVEGTPTLHSSQLLHQTGLLSPSSSCQEQSWPYFPLSSFCLPPLGSNPTFSLCGNGAGWSSLCSAPAHMAVPGLQQSKSTLRSLCWRRWGCPHGTVGVILVFSVLSPALPGASDLPYDLLVQVRSQNGTRRPRRGTKHSPHHWLADCPCFHLSWQHSDKEPVVSVTIWLAIFCKFSTK